MTPDHKEHKVLLVLKDPKALREMSALKVQLARKDPKAHRAIRERRVRLVHRDLKEI